VPDQGVLSKKNILHSRLTESTFAQTANPGTSFQMLVPGFKTWYQGLAKPGTSIWQNPVPGFAKTRCQVLNQGARFWQNKVPGFETRCQVLPKQGTLFCLLKSLDNFCYKNLDFQCIFTIILYIFLG